MPMKSCKEVKPRTQLKSEHVNRFVEAPTLPIHWSEIFHVNETDIFAIPPHPPPVSQPAQPGPNPTPTEINWILSMGFTRSWIIKSL